MNINERFKELRKSFGLSQEELGSRIGLSKSGISNIESGTRNVTDKHIKLICSEFPINEDWLRSGIGEMKKKTPFDTMEQLKKEFNLDNFSFNLVHEYLKLAPSQREKVRDFFYRTMSPEESNYYTANISGHDPTIAELEEEYKKSRSKSAKIIEKADSVPETSVSAPENAMGKLGNEAPVPGHAAHEMTREELHAELDRQLDEEKEPEENAPGYGHGGSGTAAE